MAFAIGHFDDLGDESRGRQRGRQLFPPFAADGRDGDDEQALMFRAEDVAEGFAGTLQEAVLDHGVIGDWRKRDGYTSHAFSS